MNNNRYYNYAYLDPTKPCSFIIDVNGKNVNLNFEPFYIGKGTGKRYKQHKYKSGRFMSSKLKSLNSKNIKPIIELIITNINEFEACENEKILISRIGRRDLKLGPLCNLNNGGKEGYNNIKTKETRKKLSTSNKNKKLSEEHRKKIGLSNSISLLGKISPRRKKVFQYNISNNILIKEWSNVREAENTLNIKNISRAALKNLTAGGFKWKYLS